MHKKIIAILLAGAMAMSMAACGKKAEEPVEDACSISASNIEDAESAAEEAEETIEAPVEEEAEEAASEAEEAAPEAGRDPFRYPPARTRA